MLPDGWLEVLLGEVLTQSDRRAPVEAERTYRLLGVRWYSATQHG